jgi:uncharacterized protein YndB with AHSA1/START domain
MFVYVLLAIAAIVVIFLIIVALQPSDFRIERRATIAATPPVVFAQVNDFHKWAAWSPWEKMDPNMTRTFSGSEAGAGSVYAWQGNKKVGEGRMTLTDSKPDSLIRIKLEFIKPFTATNTTEFTFTPQGQQTDVLWSMTGRNNFMAKAFCMFMNMDKMVGGDFERGLAQMKSVAESAPRT